METLNRKLAGVPIKVWILLVVAAIGIGLYLRRRSASAAQTDQSGYDTSADYYADPISGTVGGGSGGGGVGSTAPQDLSPILTAIADEGTLIASAIASIPIPATEPSPPLPA